MKKILIIGKQGQVGRELISSLAPLGEIHAFDRGGLDLRDYEQIRRVIRHVRPDVIVNAAAYTLVDRAETELDAAFAVNATAVGVLAEEARYQDALLVHYSTDYVFDGQKGAPYKEEDTTAPLNVYGKSKLAGERAIVDVGGKYLILRTSWVYGMEGHNFLLTMLRLGREKPELRIVVDQLGAPTWSRSIARATAEIISKYLEGVCDGLGDIYHLTSKGQTSWYGFAEAIFDRYHHLHPEYSIPRLVPIPSSAYPMPAARPKYSVLSMDKIESSFGVVMPDWKDALDECCLCPSSGVHYCTSSLDQ